MFHRIGDLSPDLSPNAPRDAVSVSDFRRIIRNVAEHGTPLSLTDYVDSFRKRTLPPGATVITFDDGFRDNLHSALPVLREFGVPATIFVTTGFVDRTLCPYQYVLAERMSTPGQIQFTWRGRQHDFRWSSQTGSRLACHAICRLIRSLSAAGRTQVLHSLFPDGPDDTRFRDQYLTWAELKAVAHSELITIGAHTHSHVLLNSVSRREARAEVEQSRDLLQQRLQRSVEHFSYPHGGHNGAVRRLIRSLRFQSAATVDHQSLFGSELFQIPRSCVSAALAADDRWLPFSVATSVRARQSA